MENNNIIKQEIESVNSKEAKDLKNSVNNSADKLIQNLTNIISATKFGANDISANIEINENMDSMGNEINKLLNIVNKLKIKEIKNLPQKNIDTELSDNDIELYLKKKKDLYEQNQKKIKINIKCLEDLNQNINDTLLEMRKSEFYLMSRKILG